MHSRGTDAVSAAEDASGGRDASKPRNRGTRGKLPEAIGGDRSKVIWPGLWRWDIFEGPTRILPEVPLIGELDLKNVVPDALKADRHIGQFEVHLVYDRIRELWLDTPETPFTVRRDFGIIIQPGQLHGGVREAQYPAWYIAIRFRIPEGRTAMLPGISPRQTAEIRQALTSVENPIFKFSSELGSALHHLLDEHRQRRLGMEVAARGFFLEFLAWLRRDLQRAPCSQSTAAAGAGSAALSPEIARGLAYLERNIGISLSVDKIAEAAGVSPGRFRRIFHEQIGLSPHDYLARRRVELSKSMLADSQRSVTDVAMDLGFASSAHFALVFRRFVGMAPAQFRDHGKTHKQ